MTPEILVNQLKASKKFLYRTASELREEDSTYAPNTEMFTASQQVAHIAQILDWFVEGAFGDGFDMDFEKYDALTRQITSLSEARAKCDQSYENAGKLVSSKTSKELLALMPDGPIMGNQPKLAVVAAIVEHTAHHRGVLSVFMRLCGKVPPMPYM